MTRLFFLFIIINLTIADAYAADYTVTNTGQSGAGSLNYAIQMANNSNLSRLYVIEFALTSGSVIEDPALPEIIRPVLIDGTTNEGYGGEPVITIKGNNCGRNSHIPERNGLYLQAGSNGSIIRGLLITCFQYGINIKAARCQIESNVICGNRTGVFLDAAKKIILRANIIGKDGFHEDFSVNNYGIMLQSSQDIVIGGELDNDGNIISGNISAGIELGSSNIGITISKNRIGTDINGRFAVPNLYGIHVYESNDNDVFISENIVSGNTHHGIRLFQNNGNFVLTGNLIGTDINGTYAIPNTEGVSCRGFTGMMQLGQVGYNRNVLSGNTYGAYITGGKVRIENNFIGLGKNGIIPIGNITSGLFLHLIDSCIVGSTTKDGANYISHNGSFPEANGYGIYAYNIYRQFEVHNNYIGTDYSGLLVGNKGTGVFVGLTLRPVISKNVVCGNLNHNISISASSLGFHISANLIGINERGDIDVNLTTESNGIHIQSAGANGIIGGDNPGDGNIISGNHYGIRIGSTGQNLLVKNNIIGLDREGSNARGNKYGMYFTAISGANIIENILSGNKGYGLHLESANTFYIEGNKIGVSDTYREFGNEEEGIRFTNTYSNTVKENVISANELTGISLYASSGNVFHGNYIGTDPTGTFNLRNKGNGIQLYNSYGNQIGGTAAGQANLIAFNMGSGVFVESGSGNRISANAIYANEAAKAINLNLDLGPSQHGNGGKVSPVISSALLSGSSLVLTGTSPAGDTIQFFTSDNDGQDAFEFLGAYSVISGASGNWTTTIPISALGGGYLVATATAASNNTSEMSLIAVISNCPTTKPLFTITVPCPDKPLYAGKYVDFEITNFDEGYFYDWDMDDNTSSVIETTDFLSYPFRRGGNKSIVVTKRFGNCGVNSDPVPLTVEEFVLEAGNNRLCRGEIVPLNVFPDDLPAGSYTWYRNNVIIPGQNGPELTVTRGGVYKVEIDAWNCEDAGQGGDSELLMIGFADEISEGTATKTILIVERVCIPPGVGGCGDCLGQFQPQPGKDYVISLWVREDINSFVETYARAGVRLEFPTIETDAPVQTVTLPDFHPDPSEPIMDGWQRLQAEFKVPANAIGIDISLLRSTEVDIYYDDIRIHPIEANPKTYVYDPQTLRLMAILDENNYATLYEYDQEGKLIRVKKETERGIMTIQENFNNIHKTGLE